MMVIKKQFQIMLIDTSYKFYHKICMKLKKNNASKYSVRMSSVQSVIAQPRRNLNEYAELYTPTYNDTVAGILPIPFYVTDQGVLEIKIQDNVQANILTVGGPDVTTFRYDRPSGLYRVMGGSMLATSIGQTVIDFLNAYINLQEGSVPTGSYTLLTQPVMTKVQVSTDPAILSEGAGMTGFTGPAPLTTSSYQPSGIDGVNGYVTGAPVNNYRTVWVFKSPMTIKYLSPQFSTYRTINLMTQLF